MLTRVEDVLEEGDNYVMKATNSPVPVQVQEILRADAAGKACFDYVEASGSLNPSGRSIHGHDLRLEKTD